MQLVQRRSRRNRRRRLALFAVGGCLGLLIFLGVASRKRVASLPILTIHEIEVSGNRTIPASGILDVLGLQMQDPWWKYHPDEILARAATHPRIRNLTLHYAWFHRLRVEVVEREPILVVIGGPDGEITTDGWFLPREHPGEEPDLPILRPAPGTLPSVGAPVDRHTANVARLVADLRDRQSPVWRELSEIDLAGADAHAYLRSLRGVIVFTPEAHNELWTRVPYVLDDLTRNHRCDAVVDLRYPDRILVHLPDAVPVDSAAAGNDTKRI